MRALQFEQLSEFRNAFEYGEKGEKFYIVLKGVVSLRQPNPAIKGWLF